MTGEEFLKQLKENLADPRYRAELRCDRKDRRNAMMERGRREDEDRSVDEIEERLAQLERNFKTLRRIGIPHFFCRVEPPPKSMGTQPPRIVPL